MSSLENRHFYYLIYMPYYVPHLYILTPPSACGSRRCVEGRCRRCRPLDSCAPRAVRSTQLSTLRPREHAPANLAAAATMESCAMTLRGCPSLGTRSPVQASVPGELSAAVPQRRVLMRPTLACDQWLCWQHRLRLELAEDTVPSLVCRRQ